MTISADYRRIAVIDIGKTNAKVVIVDAETGAETAALKHANVIDHTGLYPHYDVEILWAFLKGSLKRFSVDPGFDALSITTHGAAVALLDTDGALALPIIDYEYEYPQVVRDAYDDLRPCFGETRSPRLPSGLNIGAQLHFQKTCFPDQFSRIKTILTYAQYWAMRLTGVASNERTSLGCHSDLWNPESGEYSSLIDALDIRDRMAELKSAFDALGPIRPEIASEFGLTSAVPVYCGIHDSNASLLPHLLTRDAPFAVVSTGTWVITFGVGGNLDRLDPKRDTLANIDAYGRPVPSSRFMGGREFEMISAEIGDILPERMRDALQAAITKTVMLLPNRVPGTGPFPDQQSGWINADEATAEERYAALNLYLALMTETCLDLVGAEGPVVVEGPFALNGHYLSLLQQLLSREVIAQPGSTGTSNGAALLTGIHPKALATEPAISLQLSGLEAYRHVWKALLLTSHADLVSEKQGNC